MRRGRKPKLTPTEQVKLRSIEVAFGRFSHEVDEFWQLKDRARDLKFERNRVYGKQSAEERRASQNECSKDYHQRHRDDAERKRRHNESAKAWYQRHKDDPRLKEREHEKYLRYKEAKKNAA